MRDFSRFSRELRTRPMTIRISLELSARDLRYFRDAVRRAREAVRDADDDDIVDAISEIVADIRDQGPMPDFIAGRLPDLERLTQMVRDNDWRLPTTERERLLATFVYFGDPEDLIPDDIPGIGYLDDVIMIELLMREMRHVSDAYADFCRFWDTLEAGSLSADEQDRRLAARRRQLHERMRRRRAADRKRKPRASLW